jgi:hypothetical protein
MNKGILWQSWTKALNFPVGIEERPNSIAVTMNPMEVEIHGNQVFLFEAMMRSL